MDKVFTPEQLKRRKPSSLAEPFKKIGFLVQFFSKDPQKSTDAPIPTRFIALSEGRLLVITGIPDQVRNYGSHFSVKDKDKLQMPRISWNGEVRSVRNLRDLLTVKILNYKQTLSKSATSSTGLITVQLEWRSLAQPNPYKGEEGSHDVKTYNMDRDGLQVFIQTI